MITTLIFAGMLARPMDAWTIKPNVTVGKKILWVTNIQASSGGQDHDAKFELVLNPEAAIDDGGWKATYSWEHLELDGNPMEIPSSYTLSVGSDLVVRDKTGSDDDDVRRWGSIYGFPFPTKPVDVGDKWSSVVTPTTKGEPKITYDCEAKGVEKIKDADVLVIKCVEKEDGTDGIRNEGTWYVAKDGTILKFKLVAKNWVVPFAGKNTVDATITGEIKG